MDKLFLDANVLFSAAYRPNAAILRLWKLKNVTLCSSRYAVEEARINLAEEDQRMRLAALAKDVLLFEAGEGALPRGIFLPEKDVPILLAAITAQATHLVTGDIRHFGPFLGKKVEGVAIVLPGEYLRHRTSGG
jgi:uncharacterized protein